MRTVRQEGRSPTRAAVLAFWSSARFRAGPPWSTNRAARLLQVRLRRRVKRLFTPPRLGADGRGCRDHPVLHLGRRVDPRRVRTLVNTSTLSWFMTTVGVLPITAPQGRCAARCRGAGPRPVPACVRRRVRVRLPEPDPARKVEWDRVGRVPLWSCQSTDAVPGLARVRRVRCVSEGWSQAASSRRMVRRL